MGASNSGHDYRVVKLLDDFDGTISIKTHLKVNLGFNQNLDPAFLFIEENWHDVQKGSEYILSLISSQTLSVPQANNDLVDLWTNIWCNNSIAIFFPDGNFFVFDISLISPLNACFLCALCGI